MSAPFAEAVAELPALVRAHLLLSGSAVGIGILVGLPLAILSARSRRVRGPVLALAGLVQTIPALALLALFYPMLLIAGQATGLAIPSLGFLPALLALSLYALLPIVRNGVVALTGIDPAVIEAADGMGMTARQRLRIVELPLGAPVILAGIRTASVWTIGAATLATTVGQPSLGDLIFSGLQTENWARVLVGCAAAAALALIVDGCLALVESGLARRSRSRLWSGLGAARRRVARRVDPRPRRAGGRDGRDRSEELLRAIYPGEHDRGAAPRRRLRDGAARQSRLDRRLSGARGRGDRRLRRLWRHALDQHPRPHRHAAARGDAGGADRGAAGAGRGAGVGTARLRKRLCAGDAAGPRGRARRPSLDDLTRAAPTLRLGADLEFLTRPEWRAVRDAYGLRFADQRSYSPTFMYRALSEGSADVITAFSSDGRIAALDLVTLGDPRRALPSYEALLLLSPRRAGDSRFAAALTPLIGAIPVERMRQANLLVDRDTDKRTPAEAARWLDPPRR